MRLQKQLSRRVGNNEYSKYVIVLPQDKIKDLGWKNGQELETELKDGKIIIKPKK